MAKQYTRLDFLSMFRWGSLEKTLPWHELREDGLWLKDAAEISVFMNDAESEVKRWHPRRNPNLPALPIPFTACELAAFFLAGGGSFLHEMFLDPDNLSEDTLSALGENADEPREALRKADRLCREAASRFGQGDEGIRRSADWLLSGAPGLVAPATAGTPQKRQVGGAPGADEWRDLARSKAREIIERQAGRDLYPSQEDIADEIAADFRNQVPQVFGAGGKPLSGPTIKRHALKGISSGREKAQSIAINRGK